MEISASPPTSRYPYVLGYLGPGTQAGTEEAAESTALPLSEEPADSQEVLAWLQVGSLCHQVTSEGGR